MKCLIISALFIMK